MKRYSVISLVTISLHTYVDAENENDALDKACERDVQSLVGEWGSGADPTEEWCHSGEIDGTPFDIEIDGEVSK